MCESNLIFIIPIIISVVITPNAYWFSKRRLKSPVSTNKPIEQTFYDNHLFATFVEGLKISFSRQDSTWQQKNYMKYAFFFESNAIILVKKELSNYLLNRPKHLLSVLRNISHSYDSKVGLSADYMLAMPPNLIYNYDSLCQLKLKPINLVEWYLKCLNLIPDWGGLIEMTALHKLYKVNIKLKFDNHKDYYTNLVNKHDVLSVKIRLSENKFSILNAKPFKALALKSSKLKILSPKNFQDRYYYKGRVLFGSELISLEPKLDQGLMLINVVPGDGNCLFTACFNGLKELLGQNPDLPTSNKHFQDIRLGVTNLGNFRQQIVRASYVKFEQLRDFLEFSVGATILEQDILPPGEFTKALKNRIDAREHIDYEREAIMYMINMQKDGTWGGQLELQIIADMFAVNIKLNRLYPNKSYSIPCSHPSSLDLQLLKHEYPHYDSLSSRNQIAKMVNMPRRTLKRSCSDPNLMMMFLKNTGNKPNFHQSSTESENLKLTNFAKVMP